jgi:hypothetical protein
VSHNIWDYTIQEHILHLLSVKLINVYFGLFISHFIKIAKPLKMIWLLNNHLFKKFKLIRRNKFNNLIKENARCYPCVLLVLGVNYFIKNQ